MTKFDLTAGTAQTRQLDLQGVLYGVVEGARLDGWIPVTVRDDSEGLLNPETGVYTPLPTTWLKDQAVERSPFIVAASDTMLLVKYGEIYYTTNDIGTDGALQLYHLPRGVWDHFGSRLSGGQSGLGAGDAAGPRSGMRKQQ